MTQTAKEPFRATPQMVLWAYAKTGLKAASGCYLDNLPASCGCPAGMLALAAGIAEDDDRVCIWLLRKAGKAYEAGFCEGFDTTPGRDPRYSERELDRSRNVQGCSDGRTARLAVEAAGLFRVPYLPWLGHQGMNRETWLAANCPKGFSP